MSRLSAKPPWQQRRGARWLRLEVCDEGRRWGFQVPVFAVAALLVGLEVVAYPLAWLTLRLVAEAARSQRLRDVLSAVPAFPISRVMWAVAASGAPFCVSAEDGDDGFLMCIE